jgi:hypothetical protein
MLICEVKDTRNFIFVGNHGIFFKKQHIMFIFELTFTIIKKEELMLIKLLATTNTKLGNHALGGINMHLSSLD